MKKKLRKASVLRGIAVFSTALFFVFFSCEEAGEFADADTVERVEEKTRQAAGDGDAEIPRTAVLLRGNHWESGVAGFGENGFASIAGEYRLRRGSGKSGEADFSVYLTAEPLYFSDEWREFSAPGVRALYRAGEEGSFAALTFDGAAWAAVFYFPAGGETAGLGQADLGLFLRAWRDSFVYFLSFAKTPADLSLPAAVEF